MKAILLLVQLGLEKYMNEYFKDYISWGATKIFADLDIEQNAPNRVPPLNQLYQTKSRMSLTLHLETITKHKEGLV